MASIIPRRNQFCVVYAYTDASGKKHQKWETYPTMEDAKKRKTEIEYNQMTGSFTIPECSTISELLDEYVELYPQHQELSHRHLDEYADYAGKPVYRRVSRTSCIMPCAACHERRIF